MDDARTTESLLARRALAEKAMPGKWVTAGISAINGTYCNRIIYSEKAGAFPVASMSSMSNPKCAEDADYIAANSPDVIMADIDEILRLRAEVERLEKEADCLATWLANAYIDRSLLPEIDNGMSPPDPYQVREAARKAVEENPCKN